MYLTFTFNLQCMGHCWYLSAEMQMFICTPLLLIPMWHLNKRWGKRAALALCFAFLSTFWIVILSLSIVNDWKGNPLWAEYAIKNLKDMYLR